MTVLALDPILTRRAEVQRLAAVSLRRRQRGSRFLMYACGVCVVVALIPLVGVIVYVVQRGIQAWSVGFFTHEPTPEGIPGGGIWNSIVGTFIIDGIAAARRHTARSGNRSLLGAEQRPHSRGDPLFG